MGFDIERVRAQFPGRTILWLPSTRTTMEDAARLETPGSAVVADEQTEGQGRLGRRWHSAPGEGLYVSVALPARGITPVVTLALGLATGEAIAAAAGVACDLRWPNDVLTGGKKCAGILVQLAAETAVAGIGVNVDQAEFPPELAGGATSLRLAGARVAREELLIALLGAIDRHLELLGRHGPGAILDLFAKASSYALGRRVVVEMDGKQVRGTTDGLDLSGLLWLRGEDGSRRLIVSGGVRPE
jgi:BirA family biotin operon repressor/biotin-[acetyl-CoA-carboxylase] ligase